MGKYDAIIIGAGLYGLYAALFLSKKKKKVLVVEADAKPFSRATYINQARVHQGYHYPRSISTALKSAGYFERFVKEYDFCINKEFEQVYATSSLFSWTDRNQFKDFCNAAGIMCEELNPNRFFKKGMCDGAFLTREYTYDAKILRDWFLAELAKYGGVDIRYGQSIRSIDRRSDDYILLTDDESVYSSPFVLNATYAGTNTITKLLGYDLFEIKYELCEIILCEVDSKLRKYGFTVMDGPFFSIMPFGKTGCHSLTAVTFTPHTTSYMGLPMFDCQSRSEGVCSGSRLGNCNSCSARPKTAFPYMSHLARKYLTDDYSFTYKESLFSVKPILLTSEVDDSRPTVIHIFSRNPTFVSVLSGKINTVYDIDEVLDEIG